MAGTLRPIGVTEDSAVTASWKAALENCTVEYYGSKLNHAAQWVELFTVTFNSQKEVPFLPNKRKGTYGKT